MENFGESPWLGIFKILNHECALASLDRAASGKMMRGRLGSMEGKKPAGGH